MLPPTSETGPDVALFFGLSARGRRRCRPTRRALIATTSTAERDGVFNFEGGCYRDSHRLTPTRTRDLRDQRTFGTVLENVAIDAYGSLDLD